MSTATRWCAVLWFFGLTIPFVGTSRARSADVLASGLIDERRARGVTVIEWADRMGELLPPGHLAVTIEGSGDEPRRLVLTAPDPAYARYLAALAPGVAG